MPWTSGRPGQGGPPQGGAVPQTAPLWAKSWLRALLTPPLTFTPHEVGKYKHPLSLMNKSWPQEATGSPKSLRQLCSPHSMGPGRPRLVQRLEPTAEPRLGTSPTPPGCWRWKDPVARSSAGLLAYIEAFLFLLIGVLHPSSFISHIVLSRIANFQ